MFIQWIYLNKNYIDIYVGISDFLAGKIMVKNPFI